MSSFRDDAPPWSFFIPVTLAVIVGVLAADAIRHAIGTVFGGGEAPSQVEAGPRDAPEAREQATPEPAPTEPATEPAPAPAPELEPESESESRSDPDSGPGPAAAAGEEREMPDAEAPPRTDGVLELPDSMTARRDGAPAACVNGTVANRVEGGWEQALENDAPIPCVVVNR